MSVLLWRVDQESSHNTSKVTSHVDHVISLSVLHSSSIFSWSKCNQFVFLFLSERRKTSVSVAFFEHRVERGVIIYHQSAFQPVTSFVAFVEGVLANTFTFRSYSRSQLSIEVSSNDWNGLFIVRHVFLNCFVHLLDVVIRTFRVWEVHTHQIDVLTVDQDHGLDGTFVDVFGVNNSFSTFCSA